MNNNFVEQEISKSGDITLKYKNLYLHSKYNPKIEAERFAKKHYKKASIQILIGYGAGYIYEELKKMIDDDERILVIDPIIFKKGQENFLTEFDEENIKNFINKEVGTLDTLNIIVSINYHSIIEESEAIQLFYGKLVERVTSNIINENTIRYFTAKWNENYLKNLKFAKQDASITELFSNRTEPIIVASGGPSLTKQLPSIKKYRDKIILIAAGTTINSLLSNNIKPDLVVSVDGGEINYNHFKNLKINDYPLVYSPTVHYGVRRSFKQAYTCILHVEEDLISHYEKFSEKPSKILIGGSSVANIAYNLALYMTKGPVALIGQDLAYTNGQTHAEGNLNRDKVKKKKIILHEGYYGVDVETDAVFLQMRDGFELILKELNVQERSYNCTEGGLKIPSFNQKTLEGFLEEFTNKNVEFNIQKSIVSIEDDIIFEKYEQDLDKFHKLIKLFKEALAQLKKNRSKTDYSQTILKKLNKIDKEIQTLISDSSLKYAYSFINLNLLKYFKVEKNADLEKKYEFSYKQNVYMYEQMMQVTEESLAIVKELVEK